MDGGSKDVSGTAAKDTISIGTDDRVSGADRMGMEVHLGNILINGVGSGPNTNDWYGLMFMGLSAAPLIIAIFTGASWLIASVLWKCARLPGR